MNTDFGTPTLFYRWERSWRVAISWVTKLGEAGLRTGWLIRHERSLWSHPASQGSQMAEVESQSIHTLL